MLPTKGWRGRGRPWAQVLAGAEPPWEGNLCPHWLQRRRKHFFPGKAGKWVSGSIIGASLPWIHPRAFATTLTRISRVENSLFGSPSTKRCCVQGRGSSPVLGDPSLRGGTGLAAMPPVPIPSLIPPLPLGTAGSCPWHVAEPPSRWAIIRCGAGLPWVLNTLSRVEKQQLGQSPTPPSPCALLGQNSQLVPFLPPLATFL